MNARHWSEDQIREICAAKWKETLSQLATRFDTTRGAIASIWFRYGILFDAPPMPHDWRGRFPPPRKSRWSEQQIRDICADKAKMSAAQIAKRYGVNRDAIASVWGHYGPSYIHPPMPKEPPPQPGPKQLIQLRQRDCRYPSGHPGAPDFCFCAERTFADGESYCAKHYLITHTPTRGQADLKRQYVQRLAEAAR